MTFPFSCECGAPFQAEVEQVGTAFECPRCQRTLRVPERPTAPPPQPSAEAQGWAQGFLSGAAKPAPSAGTRALLDLERESRSLDELLTGASTASTREAPATVANDMVIDLRPATPELELASEMTPPDPPEVAPRPTRERKRASGSGRQRGSSPRSQRTAGSSRHSAQGSSSRQSAQGSSSRQSAQGSSSRHAAQGSSSRHAAQGSGRRAKAPRPERGASGRSRRASGRARASASSATRPGRRGGGSGRTAKEPDPRYVVRCSVCGEMVGRSAGECPYCQSYIDPSDGLAGAASKPLVSYLKHAVTGLALLGLVGFSLSLLIEPTPGRRRGGRARDPDATKQPEVADRPERTTGARSASEGDSKERAAARRKSKAPTRPAAEATAIAKPSAPSGLDRDLGALAGLRDGPELEARIVEMAENDAFEAPARALFAKSVDPAARLRCFRLLLRMCDDDRRRELYRSALKRDELELGFRALEGLARDDPDALTAYHSKRRVPLLTNWARALDGLELREETPPMLAKSSLAVRRRLAVSGALRGDGAGLALLPELISADRPQLSTLADRALRHYSGLETPELGDAFDQAQARWRTWVESYAPSHALLSALFPVRRRGREQADRELRDQQRSARAAALTRLSEGSAPPLEHLRRYCAVEPRERRPNAAQLELLLGMVLRSSDSPALMDWIDDLRTADETTTAICAAALVVGDGSVLEAALRANARGALPIGDLARILPDQSRPPVCAELEALEAAQGRADPRARQPAAWLALASLQSKLVSSTLLSATSCDSWMPEALARLSVGRPERAFTAALRAAAARDKMNPDQIARVLTGGDRARGMTLALRMAKKDGPFHSAPLITACAAPRDIGALVKQLQSPRPRVAAAALKALTELRHPKVASSLAKLYDKSDTTPLRHQIAPYLQKMQHRKGRLRTEVIERVEAWRDAQRATVESGGAPTALDKNLVSALGNVGVKRDFPLLKEALYAARGGRKTAYIIALGHLGNDKAVPLLRGYLTRQASERGLAALALASLKHQDCAEELATLLSPGNRLQAPDGLMLIALSTLSPERASVVASALAQEPERHDAALFAGVAFALLRSPDGELSPLLESLVGSDDHDLRQHVCEGAVNALVYDQRSVTPELSTLLAQLTLDPSDKTRARVAAARLMLGDTTIRARLFALLRDDLYALGEAWRGDAITFFEEGYAAESWRELIYELVGSRVYYRDSLGPGGKREALQRLRQLAQNSGR